MVGLAQRARQLLGNRIGNMMLVGALATPMLVGGTAVAVDLSRAVGFKAALQSGADAAALASARELALRSTTAEAVTAAANGYLSEQLTRTYRDATVKADATILRDRSGVQVEATGELPALFGRVFGWPKIAARVTATARTANSTPLCVLALEPSRNKSLSLSDEAELEANGCGIIVNSAHNSGLMITNNAELRAEAVCTVGGFGGNKGGYTPAPTTDCPALADPLADRHFPGPGSCNHTNLTVSGQGLRTLNPGTYCGGIRMTGKVQVTFSPGVYYIKDGVLSVGHGVSISGDAVTFAVTGTDSRFYFDQDSKIDLTATRSGPFAGFLFVGDKNGSSKTHRIESNDARNLLGTIYLPNDTLVVATEQPIADESAFTVVVVRNLGAAGQSRLVLNSDYAGTDVPVPNGVGPRNASPFLTE